MKYLKKIIIPFVLIVFIFSCSKDDSPAIPPQENKAPEISEQSFNVSEDILDVTLIGTITATDPEDDTLTFSITSNNDNLFEITEAGVLSLIAEKTLDFETAESHSITVEVSDGELNATAKMTITVINVNESPEIKKQSFNVSENILDDTIIGVVTAIDPEDDTLTYSITANSSDLFEITDAGVLSLASSKNLDFETAENHIITVEVSDGELSTTTEITFNVIDNNENIAPVIDVQSFTVAENITDEIEIGTVVATDATAITYSITANSNDLFEITDDGILSLVTSKNLDFETTSSHLLLIKVSDGQLTTTAEITINITDINENIAPEIEAQSFTVAENITDEIEIGTVVATDVTELIYSITTNSDDLFEITEDGILSLASGKNLDFEIAESHVIIVEVSDGEFTASAEITINITDISENIAPEIEAQSFTVAENITDDTEIGTVLATDTTELTYSIITNSNDLFEITDDGILSLATGKLLDFETANSHIITIEVSDGELTATAEITIIVTDILDTNPDAFITTWETSTALESITIPTNPDYTYNYSVDWGDGNTSVSQTGNTTHTYDAAGVYSVSITGNFPAIYFNAEGDKDKIQTIAQWGSIEWQTMDSAFKGCTNLTYTATDSPNLNNVTDLKEMFSGTTSFNGDLNNWDVNSVTNMFAMFEKASSFNQSLNNWDVSSVENMNWMFKETTSFNSDINNWDVSSVTVMNRMFYLATSFNQSLNNWDVSEVVNMDWMFKEATSFNGNISNWDVSSLRVTEQMFLDATAFNNDISNWDLRSILRMNWMFSGANSFNIDISSWDVSSAIQTTGMFSYNTSFDQNLGSWELNSMRYMGSMFNGSNLSIANYDATLKGWAESTSTPDDITFGAQGLLYCDEGEIARITLIAKGWYISGDNKSTDCP